MPQRPQVQVEAVPQVEAVDPAAGAAAAAAGDRFQGEAEAEAAAAAAAVRVDRCRAAVEAAAVRRQGVAEAVGSTLAQLRFQKSNRQLTVQVNKTIGSSAAAMTDGCGEFTWSSVGVCGS